MDVSRPKKSALSNNNRIALLNGVNSSKCQVFAHGAFEPLPDLVTPRAWAAAAFDHTQRRIYLFGGLNDRTSIDTIEFTDIDHPQSKFVQISQKLLIPRRDHRAISLDTGNILIGAGRGPEGTLTKECELFHPGTHTTTEAPSLPCKPHPGQSMVGYRGTAVAITTPGAYIYSDGDWSPFPSPDKSFVHMSATAVDDIIYLVADYNIGNILIFDGTKWSSLGLTRSAHVNTILANNGMKIPFF